MTALDYVCAMNWVEQYRSILSESEPTMKRAEDAYGWDMVNWSSSWQQSPQGYDIWDRRYDYMYDAQFDNESGLALIMMTR